MASNVLNLKSNWATKRYTEYGSVVSAVFCGLCLAAKRADLATKNNTHSAKQCERCGKPSDSVRLD